MIELYSGKICLCFKPHVSFRNQLMKMKSKPYYPFFLLMLFVTILLLGGHRNIRGVCVYLFSLWTTLAVYIVPPLCLSVSRGKTVNEKSCLL